MAKRLAFLRNQKGVTQEHVADNLGISRSTYGHYEIGRREPSNEILHKLADYYGVTSDYLIGRDTPAHVGQKDSTLLENIRQINVYGLNPAKRDDIFAQNNIIGYVPISADIMADYAVSMNDDSMLPSIKQGAKVIIQEQKTFTDGEAVLAQLPNGTYTIRRATQTDDDGIILTPDNAAYSPQHYNSASVSIFGIVTHLITDFT